MSIFSYTDVITEWECLRKKLNNEASPDERNVNVESREKKQVEQCQEECCNCMCDSKQDTNVNGNFVRRPRTPDYPYPSHLGEDEEASELEEIEEYDTMIGGPRTPPMGPIDMDEETQQALPPQAQAPERMVYYYVDEDCDSDYDTDVIRPTKRIKRYIQLPKVA